jgi:AraC-like DNA-binding protein
MLLAPPSVASFHFSTEGLPVPVRNNAVRHLRERGLLPLEPLPGHMVQVEIAKCFLPGLSILSGMLGGLRQEGTPHTSGINDDVFFTVNLSGRSMAMQRHREIAFGDGDAVVLNGAHGNFTVVRPAPVRFVGLRVPRKQLAPLVAGLDDRRMQLIPGSAYPLKLLSSYLGALADLQTPSPEISRLVVTHVHDLIALSIGATRDAAVAAAASVRAARLQAIKADVMANLEDGTLTVAAVAARHGVTRRYVHKLFESEGITFTQFILHHRLDRAHRLLRDQRFVSRNITTIAYDVGFSDLSYFNRAFRRRYGATPSDIRAAPSDGEWPVLKPAGGVPRDD